MSEENTIAEKIVRNRITLLNFICIIFVVVWHAENLEVYHIESAATGFAGFVNWAEHYWYAVGRVFTLQTFFFISGFLFYRSFSADKILDKYKSRLRTLVIPYLCWCTIYYLLFVLIGKIPFLSSMVNFRPRELSLSAWIASLWTKQYYTLWFMKHLIVFVLLCPLFYLVFKNRRGLPTGTAALILLLSYCYFGWGPNPAGISGCHSSKGIAAIQQPTVLCVPLPRADLPGRSFGPAALFAVGPNEEMKNGAMNKTFPRWR